MQRLFSMFPRGLPGLALLLLRVAVAIAHANEIRLIELRRRAVRTGNRENAYIFGDETAACLRLAGKSRPRIDIGPRRR